MKSFRILLSSIKEGLQSCWKNKSMGIASIISISSMLIILGGITLGVFVANKIVDDMATKVDQIDVIISPQSTSTRSKEIGNEISKIKNVKSVRFVTKEEALKKMQADWEKNGNGFLLNGMEDALPESYEINVSDIKSSDNVAKEISNISDVEKVIYYKDVVQKVTNVSNGVKYVGIVLVATLILVSFFLMSITIKLTVISRKKEINIKKYIGATNSSITGPFIIEGMIYGFIGSLVAFLIMFFAYKKVNEGIISGVGNFLSNYLLSTESFGIYLSIAYFSIGIGIGVLASIFSSRKYMKV